MATAGCLGPVFDATLMLVVVKVEGEAGGAIAKDKITPGSSKNTLFHKQVKQLTAWTLRGLFHASFLNHNVLHLMGS